MLKEEEDLGRTWNERRKGERDERGERGFK